MNAGPVIDTIHPRASAADRGSCSTTATVGIHLSPTWLGLVCARSRLLASADPNLLGRGGGDESTGRVV